MRYDAGVVTRLRRRAAALALAWAIGAVPLAADWCALSCETGHAAAPAPSCHHTGAPAPRIGNHPVPCSHDHRPVVVVAATTGTPAPHVVVPAAILHERLAGGVAPGSSRARADGALHRSPPLDIVLGSPLRI